MGDERGPRQTQQARFLRPLPRLRGRDREGAPLAHERAASPSPPSPASGGGSERHVQNCFEAGSAAAALQSHKSETRISAMTHFSSERKREKKALLLFLSVPVNPRNCAAARIVPTKADPEKWIRVFGKDHARTESWSGMTIRRKVITLYAMPRGARRRIWWMRVIWTIAGIHFVRPAAQFKVAIAGPGRDVITPAPDRTSHRALVR